MPYTEKQIAYFHANPGVLSKSQMAEADASVKGGNYLPPKKKKKGTAVDRAMRRVSGNRSD